jgi:hypothetical protein
VYKKMSWNSDVLTVSYKEAGTEAGRYKPVVKAKRRASRLQLIPKHIEKETPEEQRASGRYNPGLVLVLDGVRYHLQSGYDDSITVFSDSTYFFVLSENRRLPYVGLDVFEMGDPVSTESCFLQEHQCEQALGPGWEDLGPAEMVEKLLPYCGE